ncbi:unnamed protein product, partial [Prorocentrum cordatum]
AAGCHFGKAEVFDISSDSEEVQAPFGTESEIAEAEGATEGMEMAKDPMMKSSVEQLKQQEKFDDISEQPFLVLIQRGTDLMGSTAKTERSDWMQQATALLKGG